MRLSMRLARARRSAAASGADGDGVGGGASLEPIRKGRVTNRSASACAHTSHVVCLSFTEKHSVYFLRASLD